MIQKQQNNAFSFSLRIWFLTLFLGTLLYFIFEVFITFGSEVPINMFSTILGIVSLLITSIPFFFIFLIFNKFIFKTIENKTHIKLVISLSVGFILFNLSWLLSFEAKSVFFFSCLLLVSTILIWKIKIIIETEIYHDIIIDDNKDLDF